MKARLKGFDSYSMKFITYVLLFGVKTQIFFKTSFILKRPWIELRFCIHVLINERATRINILMDFFYRNDTLLLLNSKNLLGLQKIQKN